MFAPQHRRKIAGWLACAAAMAAVLGTIHAFVPAEPIAPGDLRVSGAEAQGTQVVVRLFWPALY